VFVGGWKEKSAALQGNKSGLTANGARVVKQDGAHRLPLIYFAYFCVYGPLSGRALY